MHISTEDLNKLEEELECKLYILEAEVRALKTDLHHIKLKKMQTNGKKLKRMEAENIWIK